MKRSLRDATLSSSLGKETHYASYHNDWYNTEHDNAQTTYTDSAETLAPMLDRKAIGFEETLVHLSVTPEFDATRQDIQAKVTAKKMANPQ